MDDMIKFYSSSDSFSVNLYHSKLSEAGIESHILNQQDSSYLTFGQIHLYIRKEDIEEAKKVLQIED